MPVVIDQFEIVRDQQRPSDNAAPKGEPAPAASSTPPPLGPQDIDVTLSHLSARVLRLRAS